MGFLEMGLTVGPGPGRHETRREDSAVRVPVSEAPRSGLTGACAGRVCVYPSIKSSDGRGLHQRREEKNP